MVLRTESFKEVCSLILAATDSNEISTLTETLELVTEGRTLYLNVTNKEYYASVKFDLDHEEEFHATVNATLFLKLIAAVTTEAIELEMHDNYITVKANGITFNYNWQCYSWYVCLRNYFTKHLKLQ